MPRIIAIANQKGGVGKTTTAINLGHCLALADKSCLLVDIDPQANATSGLGLTKDKSVGIYQALSIISSDEIPTGTFPGILDTTKASQDKSLPLSKKLKECIVSTSIQKLDLLPSTPLLVEIEKMISTGPDGHRKLKTIFKALSLKYDYVLIDCPPSHGIFPLNALNAADGVIIPIQCEYFAMEGLTQILNVIKQTQAQNKGLKIDGILLTMYDHTVQFSKEVSFEVSQHFPQLIYKSIIPRDIALAESSSHGLPVLNYEPYSRGAYSYVEFAREVLAKNKNQ